MRLARKLFLLAVMALAALALTASTASAQTPIEAFDEESGQHCSAVTLVGHAVSGGCHVQYESEEHIPLVAYVPTAVIVSNCDVHLTARIGENGEGYVTAARLTTETTPTNPPCTRAPCDEATGAMNPWQIHIDEEGPNVEEVEATFCLRTVASGPGGAGSSCEVHLPMTTSPSHNHEFGDHAEYYCETAPVPTSIRDVHFVNENVGGTEDVELVH